MKFDINSFLEDARKEFISAASDKDNLDLKKIDISEQPTTPKKSEVDLDDLRGIAYVLGFRKLNRLLSIMSRLK